MGGIYGAGRGIYSGASYVARGGDDAFNRRYAQLKTIAQMQNIPEPEQGVPPLLNGFMTAIDLVSRGLYGVTGAADVILGNGKEGEAIHSRVFRELFSGINGIEGDKEWWDEVLEQADVPEGGRLSDLIGKNWLTERFDPTARGAVALGLDIFTDPTTYITVGAGGGAKFLSRGGIIRGTAKLEGLAAEAAHVKFSKIAKNLGPEWLEKLSKAPRGTREYGRVVRDIELRARRHLYDRAVSIRNGGVYKADRNKAARAYIDRARKTAGLEHKTNKSAQRMMQAILEGKQPLNALGDDVLKTLGITSVDDLVAKTSIRFMGKPIVDLSQSGTFNRFLMNNLGGGVVTAKFGKIMASGTPAGKLLKGSNNIRKSVDSLFNRDAMDARKFEEYIELKQSLYDRIAFGGTKIERRLGDLFDGVPQKADDFFEGLSRALDDPDKYLDDFLKTGDKYLGVDRARGIYQQARTIHDELWNVDSRLLKLSPDQRVENYIAHVIRNFADLNPNQRDAIDKALGEYKKARGRLVTRPSIGRFQEERVFETFDDLMGFYDNLRSQPGLKHLEIPKPDLQLDARQLLEARMKASNEMAEMTRFLEKVGYKFARIKDRTGAALLEEFVPAIQAAVRASRGEISEDGKELLARLLSTSSSVQLGEGQTRRLFYRGLQGIEEAVKDGVLDPGAAKQLRKLVDGDEAFNRDTVVEFIDTVRTITDDEARALGVDKTAGVALGETTSRIENDVMHTTIRLYKGANAETVTKEWYRRGYGRLLPKQSAVVDEAFEAVRKAAGDTFINPETGAAYRDAADWFATEGKEYFYNAGKFLPEGTTFTRPATTVKKKGRSARKKGQQDLFETEDVIPSKEAVERALEVTGMFEQARGVLKRIAARVIKMKDHKVDESVRKLFDDVGVGGQDPLSAFNTQLGVEGAQGTATIARFHFQQGIGAGALDPSVITSKLRAYRDSLGLSQGDPMSKAQIVPWLRKTMKGSQYVDILDAIEDGIPDHLEFYLIEAGGSHNAITIDHMTAQQALQNQEPIPKNILDQLGEWGQIDSQIILNASTGRVGGVHSPMIGRKSRLDPNEPRLGVWLFGEGISVNGGAPEEVIVHELIHAATAHTRMHIEAGTLDLIIKDPVRRANIIRAWEKAERLTELVKEVSLGVDDRVKRWWDDWAHDYYTTVEREVNTLRQLPRSAANDAEIADWMRNVRRHHEMLFPDSGNRPSLQDMTDQTIVGHNDMGHAITKEEHIGSVAQQMWAARAGAGKYNSDEATFMYLDQLMRTRPATQWVPAELMTYGLTNRGISDFLAKLSRSSLVKYTPTRYQSSTWGSFVDTALGISGGSGNAAGVKVQEILEELVEVQSKFTRAERLRMFGATPKSTEDAISRVMARTDVPLARRMNIARRLGGRTGTPAWVTQQSLLDEDISRYHFEREFVPDEGEVLTKAQRKKRFEKAQERAVDEEFEARPVVKRKRAAERAAEQRKTTRRKTAGPALSRAKAGARQAAKHVNALKDRVSTLDQAVKTAKNNAEKNRARGRLEEAKRQLLAAQKASKRSGVRQVKSQSEFDRLVAEQRSFEETANELAAEQGKKLTPSKIREKDAAALAKAEPEVQAAYLYEALNNVDSIPHLAALLQRHEEVFRKIAPDVLDRVRKEMSARYYNPPHISPFGGQTWRRVEMPMGDGSNQTWELPNGIADDLVGWKDEWLKQEEVGQLLRMYDVMNNIFKGSVTSLFPAFHFRNAYSNVAQMMYSVGLSALHPLRHAEAIRLMLYGSKRGKALLRTLGLGDEFTLTTKNGLRYQPEQLLELADQHQIRVNFDQMVDIIADHPQAGKKGKAGKLLDGLMAPYRTGKAAGTQIETEARFMAWLDLIRKGYTPGDAAAEVKRVLFDYGNLSQFEKQIMRRIVPFYTWTSKNLRLQVNELMRRPGLGNNMTKPFRERGPDNDMLPEYVRGDLKMRLEKKPGEAGVWLTGIDLPINNLELLFKGNLGDTMFQWIGMMNPFLKGILEMSFDKNTFTGKPIRGAQQVGNLGMLIEQFPKPLQEYFELEKYQDNFGNTRYMANGTKTYLVFKSWALSRMVGSAASWNAAMQNDKKAATFWKLMTGLTFREYDLTQGQRIMIRNRYKALEERLLEKGLILPLNLTRPRPDVKPAKAPRTKKRRSGRGIYS